MESGADAVTDHGRDAATGVIGALSRKKGRKHQLLTHGNI